MEEMEMINAEFIDSCKLTSEQLTDPDYSLKQIEKFNQGKLSMTCSKCHHCR